MELLQARIAPLFEWIDRLIPYTIHESPAAHRAEELRRARILLLVVAFGCFTSVAFGALRFVYGEHPRAVFAMSVSLPMLFTVVVLRRVGRLDPAAHYLCAVIMAAVIVSPFFSQPNTPVFVAMIALPLAATAIGGWRIGVMWTFFAALAQAVGALSLPLDPIHRSIASSTMIMTVACGLGLSIADYMLTRAVDDANAARDKAEDSMRIREVAEAALVDSQVLFAAAFHQSPTIMQLADPETGELLEVSQGWVDMYGYSRDEAIGSTTIDLGLLPNHRARKQFVAELSDPRTLDNVEVPMRTREGEEIVVSVSAKPIEVAGRQRLLSQALDITDRKKNHKLLEKRRRELEISFAERGRQLKASQAQLRETERLAAVGTLAAGIAHQINNPIGGVVAAAEFALLSRDHPEAEREYIGALETARDEAMRCGRIVKSVLKFARDEPTPKWVEDLNPIVRRTCELARTYVENHGGELTIDTTDMNLPVLVSPIDIEQVVLNLIRNAAESSDSGARVLVETQRMGDFAELSVIDDGRGIPEEERSKIFDPFYTTRIGEGGTGLGLSVVHGVVGDHRGKIDVESPMTGGTRIRITLPIAKDGAV